MKFQVPVTFDSANRKKDKSVSLRFTTNLEISTLDFMEMDKLIQNSGWLVFSPNELQESDIPEEPAKDADSKPFGQRLRAVKYLQWLQSDQSEPFETKWNRYKEALLDKEKERLDG